MQRSKQIEAVLAAATAAMWSIATAGASTPANSIPDASFESPVSAWFSEEGHGSYFAGKVKTADALEGQFVLAIQGWERGGSVILAPPLALATNIYSAALGVRSFGAKNSGATVEFALFDDAGKQKLASFGVVPLDGQGRWTQIEKMNAPLASAAVKGRPGIVVAGPQTGMRLEVDRAGLFAGGTVGELTNNLDWVAFPAEDLADGKAWKVRDHFACWYTGYPIGMKMLSGTDGVAAGEPLAVRRPVAVGFAGMHRLWVRLLHIDLAVNRGVYTIAVEQGGKTVASREIDDNDPKLGTGQQWVWVSLDVPLEVGPAEIVLSRPVAAPCWLSRKVDHFLMTNLLDYHPEAADFNPKGFVRFTNLSEGQPPYVLWVFVHRLAGPVYYVNPGILGMAGFDGSYYAPADPSKRLAAGQSSPWVNISRFLQPGGNLVGFTATRETHTGGFVTNGFCGVLEFAVGDAHRLVRKVAIKQDAPTLRMTLPPDFESGTNEFLTAMDYAAQAEAVVAPLGTAAEPIARWLDLNAILGLTTQGDDPGVIDREMAILRKLGFNGTYTPIASASNAVAFAAAHGMEQHHGLWVDACLVKSNCMNQVDTAALEALFKKQAEIWAPILDKAERMKLADEPGGPPYAHIVACDYCKRKFSENLKAQGLTPAALGVETWEQVVPVMPEDKDKHPELFYYTGLFRLNTFADLLKTAVGIKRRYLPNHIRTYVNYSPPLSEQLTWTQRGNDLFLCQRGGGLEMGWTEDWLGYGGSPEQMSTMYAQLRSAGAPDRQPLGGYMVVDCIGEPLLRLKYYTLIAAGVRHVNVYAYGPAYASCDSWSARYAVYPAIYAVQHELARIDEKLAGTTRRKTDVAILYNRTAGIWADRIDSYEQDSRFIQWALAHAGFDADFIPEEDLTAQGLGGYKVLYLNGPQIQRAAAENLAAWVKAGGVLFGSAGAGSRDEFNRPLAVLEPVFGVQSKDLKHEQNVGRPKYELRGLAPLDELTSAPAAGAPAVVFNQLSCRETLAPLSNAVVFLRRKGGEPAGVLNRYGQGVALRVAALPGVTYLNDAVKDKSYDIETYLPKAYRPALRDFIAWPAMLAGARRTAVANAPATEISRYEGVAKAAPPHAALTRWFQNLWGHGGMRQREVVFVVDYQATPRPDFRMTLGDAGQFRKAWSARGQPVKIVQTKDNSLEVAFPLDTTDAIVLEQ